MARLSAEPIDLSEAQRNELERLVRKRSAAQQQVKRAKIILLADQGVGIRETSRRLEMSRDLVQCWRRRWLATQEIASVQARLADLPRSGAPAIYTPEQICAIVALGCQSPESYGRPITHWTQQELADEAVKQGIVQSISQRSVGRFLKTSGLATASVSRMAEQRQRPRV